MSHDMRIFQQRVLHDGLLVLNDNHELVVDLLAVFIGFCSWCSFTNMYDDTEPAPLPVRLHINFEVLYYTTRLIVDRRMWFHHVLSLMILYFAWNYKMGVSMSMFTFGLSNPFMSIVQRETNFENMLMFMSVFFMARVLGGAFFWYAFVIDERNTIPGHLYAPCALAISGIYAMQLVWFRKLAKKLRALMHM